MSKSIPDPLTLFSSVTLHGLTDSDNEECTITLTREQSFPAKRFSADEEGRAPVGEQQWDAVSPPADGLHADLQITDQLGEGRMGQVFAAHLVSLKKSIHGETLPAAYIPLPSQFCIKLAKPEYIRSLAREAWFYEQLSKEDGNPGAVTPVCFGFFTRQLPNNVHLRSWSSVKIKPEKPSDVPEGEEPNYDLLVDDEEGEYRHFDDERRSHLDSPWHLQQWKARTDRSPFVGILITERLGAPMPTEYSPPRGMGLRRRLPEEVRTELLMLLDDLNAVGIVHGDIKFNNILSRASESWLSSEVCPRHKQVHTWRLVDFDRSFKYDPANPIDSWYLSTVQNYEADDICYQ